MPPSSRVWLYLPPPHCISDFSVSFSYAQEPRKFLQLNFPYLIFNTRHHFFKITSIKLILILNVLFPNESPVCSRPPLTCPKSLPKKFLKGVGQSGQVWRPQRCWWGGLYHCGHLLQLLQPWTPSELATSHLVLSHTIGIQGTCT